MPRPKKKKDDVFDLNAPTNAEAEERSKEALEGDEAGSGVMTSFARGQRIRQHQENVQARQAENLTYGTYADAFKKHRILNGTVASVETDAENAYLVCFDGLVTIRIPCEEAFNDIPQALTGNSPDKIDKKVQFLTNAIGAKIEFVITALDENPSGGYLVKGSRRAAMTRIRTRHYGEHAENPVKEGDIVEAKVVSAGLWACFVNVHGVDVRISNADITYRYVENLSAEYAPGTVVRLKVMSLKTQRGKLPELILSGKEVEKEMFEYYYPRVKKGTRCRATVISVQMQRTDPPRLHIALYLNDIQLPAYAHSTFLEMRDELHTGDQVYFMAETIANSGHVSGRIIRYLEQK